MSAQPPTPGNEPPLPPGKALPAGKPLPHGDGGHEPASDGPAEGLIRPVDAPPDGGPSLEEARAVLQAAQQVRVSEAQRLIRQALEQTGCLLLPEITICGEKISATIRIVPRG